MASLIENFIETLDNENVLYVELLELSKEKTKVIIKNEIERLREIVAEEQKFTDALVVLENQRLQTVKDIGMVLNKDVDTLTVRTIIDMLKGQEELQGRLQSVHDRLKRTLDDMVVVNELNQEMIRESLELIEFNINYFNGLNQMPGTANYTRNAYSAEGYANSNFDTRH